MSSEDVRMALDLADGWRATDNARQEMAVLYRPRKVIETRTRTEETSTGLRTVRSDVWEVDHRAVSDPMNPHLQLVPVKLFELARAVADGVTSMQVVLLHPSEPPEYLDIDPGSVVADLTRPKRDRTESDG